MHIEANKKALILLAKTIGIKMISGGMGKNELSANDIMPRNQGAFFSDDFFNVQL